MSRRGTVVSCFDRIANMRQDSGRICTICTSDYAPAATRYRVRPDDWRMLGPTVGDSVLIDSNLVYVGSRKCEVICDPEIRIKAGTDTIHESWIPLLEQLSEASLAGGTSSTYEQILDARLSDLALRLPAAGAVRGLLGLGQGMTPSGDDILVGYMAVEHRLGIAASVQAVCNIVRDEAWSRTNEFSATMLEAASHGFVAADVLALLDSLSTKASQTAVAAFTAYIRNTGHFSGRDTVFGITCGIRNAHHHSNSGRQTA